MDTRTERTAAIEQAGRRFDSGAFERQLASFVAVPSTSQDPEHAGDLHRYLAETLGGWLATMGFTCVVHPNPAEGFGPILVATRMESPALPTVVSYGHGDTVDGMDAQWTGGRTPWVLRRDGGRCYAAAPRTIRGSTSSTCSR